MKWIVLCCLCTLLCDWGVNGQNEIRASFNMTGVKGNIEFRQPTPNKARAIISITVSKSFKWEIREFPVLTTDGQACDDASLGKIVQDLTGFLDSIDDNTQQGTSIDMTGVSLTDGENAILGRSVLLINDDQRACATIQGPEPLSFSVLKGHIAGNIQVRPVGTRFAVFTDLFNTKSLVSSRSTLRIYRGDVTVDLPSAQSEDIDIKDRCSFVSMISMVEEIRNVPIAAGGNSSRFMAYVSPNTNSFDFSSGCLKIGEDSDTSCANIHRYEPKKVQAVFSRDEVNGYMIFQQDNPYKPTTVQVNLQNLNNRASGYHVHLFPLPYEYTPDTNLCGSDVTSGHFNPLLKTTGTTQEEFEIGDLSNKHGSLDSLQDINQTFTDLYLPLFGQHSIVGRSIVIHSPTGDRWICASIGYPGPVSVAKAEFNGDVEGTITFVQEEDKPWADTTVFVEMTDAGETSETTLNHNYHIHTDPIGDDYLTTEGRCASVKGHWNPFNAAVTDSSIYRPTCAANRLGCEVGDLNNKYNETINIAASPGSSKYFYTDEIPLSGAYSVIRRSVTIHQQQAAAPRYVCADIVRKLSPVVTTENRWYGAESSDTTTGEIKMSSSGLNSHITSLNVDLTALNRIAGGYHIHELPLNTMLPGSNVCGTTGGHYNPFVIGAGQWKSADSLDNYELGDLSNKFGMLTDQQSYRLQAIDTNLPLGGAYSVAGRSVVIHDSATRWKCTNTIWDTQAMNGTLLQARADFNGDIQGHITLSQVITSEGESDINVEVMLWYENEQQSPSANHNWHVHVSTIDNTDCASAGGHYNPFLKNTGGPSYSECGSETPRKCEVGDLSGKFGTINIGTKASPARYVFNDNFLSLSGKFSVMGRSIVIHTENSGAPRLACADLAPFGPSTHVIQFYIRTGLDTSMSGIVQSIEDEINVDEYHNIYVRAGAQRGVCTAVSVYFTGENAAELKQQFDADNLDDDYRSVDVDSCSTGKKILYCQYYMLIDVIS